MPKPRITKTLSIDREIGLAIEKIAKSEHRSWTKTVELILENYIKQRREKEKESA